MAVNKKSNHTTIRNVRDSHGRNLLIKIHTLNYSGDFFPLLISVSIAFLSSSSVILEQSIPKVLATSSSFPLSELMGPSSFIFWISLSASILAFLYSTEAFPTFLASSGIRADLLLCYYRIPIVYFLEYLRLIL